MCIHLCMFSLQRVYFFPNCSIQYSEHPGNSTCLIDICKLLACIFLKSMNRFSFFLFFNLFFFISFRDLHKTLIIFSRDFKKYKVDNLHLSIQHCETYSFLELILQLGTESNPKIPRDFLKSPTSTHSHSILESIWRIR